MRDLLLLPLADESGVDIDIIDGEARYLSEASQTLDQRAAIAAYAVKGTMPGLPEYGVSWSEQYTRDHTLINLSNDINLQIQQLAVSADSDSNSNYTPIVAAKNGGVGVLIVKG